MSPKPRQVRGFFLAASAFARCRLGPAEQALSLVVIDEAVEHAFGDLAFFGIELAERPELELERVIGAAFGVPKDQLIQADAERERDLL